MKHNLTSGRYGPQVDEILEGQVVPVNDKEGAKVDLSSLRQAYGRDARFAIDSRGNTYILIGKEGPATPKVLSADIVIRAANILGERLKRDA